MSDKRKELKKKYFTRITKNIKYLPFRSMILFRLTQIIIGLLILYPFYWILLNFYRALGYI